MSQGSPFSPYVPNTEDDRRVMLRAVGVESVEELFADIPEGFGRPTLDLPAPLSELELRRELQALSELNLVPGRVPCFLGGGAYDHFVPSVVNHVISRGELSTAYTPYQPEVSQGTLQAIFEFQSMVCQLLGMEVANSGMYDGASALAEAALMACRVTGRERIVYLDTVSPAYLSVMRTYTEPQGLAMAPLAQGASLPEDAACLVVHSPNFFGCIEDVESLARQAHESGALLVASVDPVSLGMFRPPGELGADIAVAEGQALGVSLSFGGPYVGLFTCKTEYLRQMPGRIAGRTVDTQDRVGYVLTLQTREQHIRRERATSNICTSEALVGTAVVTYLACMGRAGLRRIAELTYHKAHYAASLIGRIAGYELPLDGTFFQEFVVSCPIDPAELNRRLLDRGIIGGLDVSDRVRNGMLLCVTEMNTREEIEALATALEEIAR
ncbi:MAG: aminomethyl-transferring glycine dehydrogenase subunit GcvPA [Chloroflexota bacterium]|nr:aminomethyl-transferring glycine dehydrogenase subunit GcvPA [Chloroflexota bacterium]MDE2941830.1 aminomethyl-transferring glycine dehydrogenase subunit GcvPA [Chloroflexota bacterium]MDE3266859.1 aminomethyl-transferring glycine dehydrogenase subunit GcvPA [Chloroflexota bacterium]